MAGIMPAAAQTEFRHITFDEAKTAAKAEGKLIFVDFYTQWCGPCKRMAANVFPKKEIGDYLNPNFVCLKLDAEAEGAALAKTVEVKAYPTLMVFDADGNKLGSFAGMKDGQDFITAVEMCKNPELSPERVTARYEAGERTRSGESICHKHRGQRSRLHVGILSGRQDNRRLLRIPQ